MPIRVLHIIGSLRLGGAQVVLRQIAEHSDSRRFEHFVYPLRPANPEISITKNVLSHSRFNYDPRKLTDILRICREYKIDIIHTHLHKDAIVGLLSTFFQNVPVVVHEQGAIFLPGLQYTGFRFLLRRLHKRAAALIASSNATKKQLRHSAGVEDGGIHVIHNGVDLELFTQDTTARQKIREHLKLSQQEKVIGFLGRLHPDKGVDILIEAAGIFLKQDTSLRLLLVGNGPLENSLRRRVMELQIADRVYFAGFQQRHFEWINAFDLGCMPSRSESFPLVALELMSMKVPLICPRIGGLADIIEDRRNALVLSDGTPREISRGIMEMLADTKLQDVCIENGYALSRQFGIPEFIKKIEAIYLQVFHAGHRHTS
jgi:glycosyltransferase involved in cell wall biosynthesis